MSRPTVVVFDVNETLSDMAPMAKRFEEVGAPGSLAPLWFASLLRDGFALTSAGSIATFADLGAEQLRALLPPAGVDGDIEKAIAHVMGGFTSLELHPDVAPGLRALHATGLRLVTLSNGSVGVAEALFEKSGTRDLFEELYSVEDAGVWKPAPGSYLWAAERCGVPGEEMCLVAVHPWDIDGAARAGLQTAWVNRDGRRYPAYLTPPTHTVKSLEDLAGVLAH